MIPKIIHQSGPEDKNKWPPSWIIYQQSWKDKFPDFEYKFWNDEDIENLILTKYNWFYNTYKNYDENIKRIDASRYFILHQYGGLYTDMDYECVNNFWNKIDQDVVSFAESGELSVSPIENALMISPEKDPFWEFVFFRLIENEQKHVFEATGPIFVDMCAKQYIAITNREIKYLNRYQYSLKNMKNLVYNKYAIHHQTGVWQKPAKIISDKVIYHDNITDYEVKVHYHSHPDAFEINVFNDKITIKRIDCDNCGWGMNLDLVITKKSSNTQILYSVGSKDYSPIDINVCINKLFIEKPNKIKLKDTTLVCIDDLDVDKAISSINKTLLQCEFDKVILLTSLPNKYEHSIKIEPIRSIEEYSIFCIKELHKFIDTKYVLLIQYDGYVMDSSLWTNEFYDYDYIGGVCSWPDEDDKGGNGGVSFRSKKLLEKASEIIPLEHCHPEDVSLSGKIKGMYATGIYAYGYREELEKLGFKFATNQVQKCFSYEDGYYRNTFAHHKGNIENIFNIMKMKSLDLNIDLIEKKLEILKHTPSDINEHLDTLKKYGKHCEHITEFGFHSGTSTYALLACKPDKLISYDIVDCEEVKNISALSKQYGLNFEFIQKDTLSLDIETTDLLFIDTLHTYAQLTLELNKHAEKVRHYIIMHDTQTYGDRDENIYNYASSNLNTCSTEKRGLRQSIQDFLLTSEGRLWRIKEIYTHNNGLTILERVGRHQRRNQ